jgi:hypothetical protein
MLTQEEVIRQLNYDPNTGIFTWKISKSGNKGVGSKAGSLDKNSKYQVCTINNKRYYLHRIAFLYMTGSHPQYNVDHINGDKQDNRWSNLRDISTRDNQSNREIHRTGKLVGSCFKKDCKRWRAMISIDSINIHLGYFDTELEAHEAYMKARKHYGV